MMDESADGAMDRAGVCCGMMGCGGFMEWKEGMQRRVTHAIL